jgi:general secretion pathway protein M
MTGWWNSRTPREQWTLALGGLALLAVLIWLGLLDPLAAAHRRAEARYRAAVELDGWMDRVGEEAERRRAAGQPVGEIATVASLSGLVSESTAAAGFGDALKRVVPDDSGAVRLWFEDVAFDDLLAWMIRLRELHGVQVSAVQVTREIKREGRVRANLTLEPPGGGAGLATTFGSGSGRG